MNKNSKIYVAGHNGMVGSALVRRLEQMGFSNIVKRTRQELDLTSQKEVNAFFAQEHPDYVYMAAAKVGGILDNISNQARFLTENLQIQCNVIESAYRNGTKKLLLLGSSCVYPKDAAQPMPEAALLTGLLEPTNEGYAIAKIAGLKLCEYYNKQYGVDYVSVMPCNLYGYNDNFDLSSSHMLPALIRKFHEAKIGSADTVTVWGTGKVYRELLFVDDLADACVFVAENYSSADFLNVGYGEDFTIAQIAQLVKDVIGFQGDIVYDTAKPDGMFRKIVDSGKIRALGWKPKHTLREGIELTYNWYVRNIDRAKGRDVP
ncbi:MAG: GDP-L-fucose synthase [Coriobacteriia bacterium]|nr:GDP-L-fucose synthase [Coriobacteriia bacterium]